MTRDDGTERARVWPTGGDVPDEFTGEPLKPGAEVTLSRYVLRRIADGSLTKDDPSLAGAAESPDAVPGETGTLRPRRAVEAEARRRIVDPPPPQSRDAGYGPDELEKEKI